MNSGSDKLTIFGPIRTTEPYFLCSSSCVSSVRRFKTSKNLQRLEKLEKKAPGKDLRGDFNQFQKNLDSTMTVMVDRAFKVNSTRLAILKDCCG